MSTDIYNKSTQSDSSRVISPPSVYNGISVVNNRLDDLTGAVVELEKRLSPYMPPEVVANDTDENSTVEPVRAEYIECMNLISHRLANLHTRLANLLVNGQF